MTRSPEHFEEVDWLDYVQDRAEEPLRALLEEHLATCTACQERVAGLRKLAAGLAEARTLLQDDPDVRAATAATPQAPEQPDEQLHARWKRASEEATNQAEASDRCRSAVIEHLASDRTLRTLPSLEAGHLAAANALARESFSTDLSRASAIVEDALVLIDRVPGQGTAEVHGVHGLLRTSWAYLLLRQGEYTEALRELDLSRPLLEELHSSDLELAFWSYVRGSVLHSLSQFAEALEEIRSAEQTYADFEDWDRVARCKIVRAILASNDGRPEEAVPLYEELLQPGGPALEESLRAILYQDLGFDLVLTNRLQEAKIAYARAARLFRKTHQENLLFQIRIGIAEIAYKEKRLEEALALNEALRPELRTRHLRWDAIQRELRIIEILVRLGRAPEARKSCEAILPEAAEVGLAREVRQTLDALDAADNQASLSRLLSMQEYLQRAQRVSRSRSGAA